MRSTHESVQASTTCTCRHDIKYIELSHLETTILFRPFLNARPAGGQRLEPCSPSFPVQITKPYVTLLNLAQVRCFVALSTTLRSAGVP